MITALFKFVKKIILAGIILAPVGVALVFLKRSGVVDRVFLPTSVVTIWGYSHRTMFSFEKLLLNIVRSFNHTLSGFTVQTLIIWGLIGVAGSVFLIRYLYIFTSRHLPVIVYRLQLRMKRNILKEVAAGNISFHITAFLAFGFLSVIISGITVGWTMRQTLTDRVDTPSVAGETTIAVEAQESTPTVSPPTDQATVQVLTVVGTVVNLRKHPSMDAAIIYKLSDGEPVVKLEDKEPWIRVALVSPADEIIEGWVHQDLVREP